MNQRYLAIAALVSVGYLVLYQVSRKIRRIAEAIAKAEGYGRPGAIPTVRNNPGNIKGPDGVIRTYRTPEEGWAALYRQVTMMFTGESRFYRPDMTIAEIARIYTGEARYMDWAWNVSKFLGVKPETRLIEV
jgi:hypothetical protein